MSSSLHKSHSPKRPLVWLCAQAVVIGIFGANGSPCLPQADEEQPTMGLGHAAVLLYGPRQLPMVARQSLPDLNSPDLRVRIEAAGELSQDHAISSSRLVATLRDLTKVPNHGARGKAFDSFHVTVVLAGQLRVQEAVPMLVPLLHYELDPESLPVGGFAPMHFPVAEALVEIGGRRVLDVVMQDLSGDIPQERLILDAWILQELLGSKAARAIIDDAVDSATGKRLENLRTTSRLLSGRPIVVRGVTSQQLRRQYAALVQSDE